MALIAMPMMILAGFLLALLVASVGLSTPLLAITSIMLLIFLCFYQLAHGRNKMFLMWSLIGILMIPEGSLTRPQGSTSPEPGVSARPPYLPIASETAPCFGRGFA